MEFLKTVAGKVVAGAVGLAVIIGAISWWQMDPQTRSDLIGNTGRIIGWFFAVLLVPWATFFLIGRVAKFESNLAGGILVFVYTAAEVVLLLWLFDWSIVSAAGWTFVGVGALLAAVYNLFTCDWIAEKVT
jgi:hypothetical protein